MIDTDVGIEKCSKYKGQNQFVSSSSVLDLFMVWFFSSLNFDFFFRLIGVGLIYRILLYEEHVWTLSFNKTYYSKLTLLNSARQV